MKLQDFKLKIAASLTIMLIFPCFASHYNFDQDNELKNNIIQNIAQNHFLENNEIEKLYEIDITELFEYNSENFIENEIYNSIPSSDNNENWPGMQQAINKSINQQHLSSELESFLKDIKEKHAGGDRNVTRKETWNPNGQKSEINITDFCKNMKVQNPNVQNNEVQMPIPVKKTVKAQNLKIPNKMAKNVSNNLKQAPVKIQNPNVQNNEVQMPIPVKKTVKAQNLKIPNKMAKNVPNNLKQAPVKVQNPNVQNNEVQMPIPVKKMVKAQNLKIPNKMAKNVSNNLKQAPVKIQNPNVQNNEVQMPIPVKKTVKAQNLKIPNKMAKNVPNNLKQAPVKVQNPNVQNNEVQMPIPVKKMVKNVLKKLPPLKKEAVVENK